jgi:CPA2 family monovalent cation:H+ antiporter-2
MHYAPLLDIVILLAAAVSIVTVFRILRLSPVLGYLVAGAVIGPFGIALVQEVNTTAAIAEIGVALLLFMIGLDLSWERLKALRLQVVGIGGAQVLVTALLLTPLIMQWEIPFAIALMIAVTLSFSSTALVFQTLQERRETASQTGRISLSIILMQDLIALPLLVAVPILALKDVSSLPETLTHAGMKALVALVVIVLVGRLVLRPLLRTIARLESEELFVATVLLVVLGTGLGGQQMGLSLALGAFLAGVLLAETEFRHQVEVEIRPYKNLLMGLFFMTVGMQINLEFILAHTVAVLAAAAVLLLFKGAIIYGIIRAFGYTRRTAGHTSLLMAQSGGEFGFVIFGMAGALGVLPAYQAQFLLLVIAVTMALTPLLDALGGRLERRWRKRARLDTTPEIEEEARDLTGHVVIAGYGRMGGILADVMARETIPFIAMDTNPRHVTRGRRRHHPVYFGDAGRPDVLEAVGVKRARLMLLTSHDILKNEAALRTLRASYPDLPIFVRAKDGGDAERLYALGANLVVPEVYVSSMRLMSRLLSELEWPEPEITRVMETMRHIVGEKEV